MRTIRTFLAALFAVLMLGAVAISPANAGEVTGNGKVITINANSECAYSGLEDDDGGPNGGPGVAPQNWGQIPQEERAFLVSIGVSPSALCNGHLNPIK